MTAETDTEQPFYFKRTAEVAGQDEPQSGTLALRGDQVEWSPVQRAALEHIGIADAPEGDQQVFMHVAQRTGLDPFAKQIYMIGRKERGQGGKPDTVKYTIQTGIDGFRLIAERHPQYRGQIGAQWCGPDGVWTDVWLDPQKPPAAARVGVLRADRDEPIWGVALFREYAQTTTYNGQQNLTKMWREKGAHMVAKCAEALAIRKAFPQEIGGLHTDDELAATHQRATAVAAAASSGITAAELTGQVVDAEPVDAEPAVDDEPTAAEPDAEPDPAAGDSGPAEAMADQKQNRQMHALFREAQVTERPDRLYLTGLLLDRELDTSKGLTSADADAVIAAMKDLKASGHEEGLMGAVNDLINQAEQIRMEREEQDQAAAADTEQQDDDQSDGEQP